MTHKMAPEFDFIPYVDVVPSQTEVSMLSNNMLKCLTDLLPTGVKSHKHQCQNWACLIEASRSS